MENDEMLHKVSVLLQSDIESHNISKATGISGATISKLRSGNKDIAKSSFLTVNKLYKYYLDKEEYLEKAKKVEEDIIDIKLSKDIQSFILNLKKVIDDINDPSSDLNINEILIEKKFTMSNKSSVKLASSIKIDQLIPIQIKHSTFVYNLKIIRDYIENLTPTKTILNYEIEFNYNDLELALKRLIHRGNKVTLIKSNLNELGGSNTGLYVTNYGYNYEYKFINIHILSREGEENG
ncbi:hypothetical protein [Staphylococcus aureus]|uniref:hypothetical protein n=1 Tax=Staphylococcus aureus TaxID=1280 RepID=UPI001BFE317C|nr:hypothetical protein [Staphylococcus aureus]